MKKSNLFFIGLFAVLAAYTFLLVFPTFSLTNNDLAYRYIYLLSKRPKNLPKIIGIAVDDYSLNKIKERWPWKRSLYARAIKILDQEKVNTVGIDFVFSGESEDRAEDLALKEALDSVSSKVVLAYFFDEKKSEAVLPLEEFREKAFAVGLVNTPQDRDGKVRRLRLYIEKEGKRYNSFSQELAASFQKPLPLLKEETFLINYQLKPKDILTLSFFDVLENLPELKKRYGDDFLRGALSLIYPKGAIHHDTYLTPLGLMPGGILHLNGASNIISGRSIKEIGLLCIPLLLLSFLVIYLLLEKFGFLSGLLFTLGLIFVQFWSLVFFGLGGIRFDYSFVVCFSLFFFIFGSLYKYLYYLTQLLKIKDKATVDPLRGIFTLRYFYWRLHLELKKIYFSKELYLVFIFLERFNQQLQELTMESTKGLWHKINESISLNKDNLWALYSPDEVVGALFSGEKKISLRLSTLAENLARLFKENNLTAKISIAYLKLKAQYPLRELFFLLSKELKKNPKEVVFFKEVELERLLRGQDLQIKEEGQFLESLDADIEERNRELLSLVENLNLEQAKTKEAFFQIITSLANALEARDPYSEGHSERVSKYAVKLAEKLGWDSEEKEKIRRAALLHDIGKIGIPDSILHKKEGLTEEEFDFIKKHELIGVKILEPLKELKEILPWIMYHHERWDGLGYPHGLAREAIPLASQIISICDVFDALSTGRDYKRAFSPKDSIEELVKNKGVRFNGQLVDVFVEIVGRSPK